MPSEGPSERTDRRLHPASLVFAVGAEARSLLLPGIVVLFFASRGRGELLFMLLFVPAAIATLVH
jgi:hypothetical protein